MISINQFIINSLINFIDKNSFIIHPKFNERTTLNKTTLIATKTDQNPQRLTHYQPKPCPLTRRQGRCQWRKVESHGYFETVHV